MRFSFHCNLQLLPARLRSAWKELCMDDAAKEFLKHPTNPGGTFVKSVSRSILQKVGMAKTDVNGLFGDSPMHLLSAKQAALLLDFKPSESKNLSLLDVGAGDGNVTAHLSQLFSKVLATEISLPMKWRLQQKGIECIRLNNLRHPDFKARGPFDVISLLNVLDRCPKPLSLIDEAKQHLNEEHGRLLVSLVLPFQQLMEFEPLHETLVLGRQHADEWETNCSVVIETLFPETHWKLISLSRVPYLSRDYKGNIDALDAAVIVVQPLVMKQKLKD